VKLWGRASSVNVQKVLWTLDEIGLSFEHVDAGGDAGGLDDPKFRAMNPHGRVPVLEDEGHAFWESNAIVRYLCGRYSPGELCPADPIERALQDQWMDWAATTLQPAFMGFFWGWYRTPEPQRDAARNAAAIDATHAAFRILDKAIAGRDSGALAMGDIPTGALLFRYFTLEIERPPLPAVEAWYAQLSERPAYRNGVMLPYDELKGRTAF